MTSPTTLLLTENLNRVRGRIEDACARAGRTPSEVVLVAVTKYAELDWVRALVDLGVTDLGESRPQQLVSRAAEFPNNIRWHMIGHLQRNKVEPLLPVVSRIHSADSVRLLEALHKGSQKRSTLPTAVEEENKSLQLLVKPRVLLEVNVSGERSKDGFDPDLLFQEWPAIRRWDSILIDGLMTMAPLADDVETARGVFRKLREFRDRLVETSDGLSLPELSMGMSGDFEIGIEEGATFVRVGSSLFEGLEPT